MKTCPLRIQIGNPDLAANNSIGSTIGRLINLNHASQ
jgi:hypothetical protein